MKIEWKSCFRLGVSAFVLYLCVVYWPSFAGLSVTFIKAAVPLLIGCVVAYIMNILMTFYEKYYFPQKFQLCPSIPMHEKVHPQKYYDSSWQSAYSEKW